MMGATDTHDDDDDLSAALQTPYSFVQAHPGFREGVKSIIPWKPVIFVSVVTLGSAISLFFAVPTGDQLTCLIATETETAEIADYKVDDRVSACRWDCEVPGKEGQFYPAIITEIYKRNSTTMLRWEDTDSTSANQTHYLLDLEGIYPVANKWPMMIVADLLILFVSLVLSGAPPELTLFFCGAVAVLAGGLDADLLYGGTASNAVVTLAFLFPIMKAMGDTGLPDIFIGYMMGSPKTLRPAIFRMFLPVALLSGLFNNTPIVVMMIPLVMTFCQRLNLDHRAMLMPLSYASQAGGSLTLMGTSINFVAQEVFAPKFQIGFFTLTLGGIVILVLDIAYCTIMGPIILAKKDLSEDAEVNAAGDGLSLPDRTTRTQAAGKSMAEVQADLGKKNLFSVTILITPASPLIGTAVQDCGIHRIKGVHIVHRVFRRGPAGPPNSELATVPITGSVVQLEQSLSQWQSYHSRHAPASVDEGPAETQNNDMGYQYNLIAEGWEDVRGTCVQNEDVLQVAGTSEGIAQLRQVRGLVLGNDHSELAFLGGRRRQRVLCEAAVVEDLVGKQIDIRQWQSKLRCGVIGIRSMRDPSLCRLSYQDYTIQAGDVLLIEGFRSMMGSDVWLDYFGVVRQVPGSAPPRNGRKADLLRAVFTGVGLLLVVSLSAASSSLPVMGSRLTMPVMCTIFLTGILIAKGLTVHEAYSEINAQVLFTIVGALGMGKAMQQTRLANCMAGVIVDLVKPLGPPGILVGIYVATVGVGQFLNSAANVAIMGAIGIPIAHQMNMDLGSIALTITYAASACYMAPYGYQTNTLVLKDGGYTWGDFIKFGGGLQLVHLVVVVLISTWCAEPAHQLR